LSEQQAVSEEPYDHYDMVPGSVSDYLERMARESFDREIEQDEIIWKALPFFAAGIGLLANMLDRVASKVAHLPIDLFTYIGYAMVFLSGILILVCGVNLYLAGRMRKYRRPPYEIEMCKWASDLRVHYTGLGLGSSECEALVLQKLKGRVLSEFAEAATQNRKINYQRAEGRGRSLRYFVLASGAVLTLAVSALVHDAMSLFRSNSVASARAVVGAQTVRLPVPSLEAAHPARPPCPKPTIVCQDAAHSTGREKIDAK
jgi:hypothetical protein